MNDGMRRFLLPVLFSIIGIALSISFLQFFGSIVADRIPGWDLIGGPFVGNMPVDLRNILLVIVPVYLLEFLVTALPFSAILMLGNKIAKTTSYSQNIMEIGDGFSGFKMLKRAVAPALFALTIGELVRFLLPNWFIRNPSIPPAEIEFLGNFIRPIGSVVVALISLVIALAIYMPTWLLNDSGIVFHLKEDELSIRRCPDTEGVGRWYSNFISGFALLGYPISMINTYFIEPLASGISLSPLFVAISTFWIIGLPIIVMAFTIPVIIINELLLNKTSKFIHTYAKSLGAEKVKLERVKPTEDGQV